MGVTKLTFDGALNSAKNDALFQYFVLNKQNGVFKALGGEVTPRVSNSQIIFSDGFVSAYGRRVYVQNNTSVTVTLDSTKYGLIVLRINTSTNTAVITNLEGSSSSYPTPTQDDLASDDGIYDVVLCEYYKTASSLTIGTTKVSYIKLNGRDITLDQLSADTKKYITDNFGDLNEWINTQIEAVINLLKSSK